VGNAVTRNRVKRLVREICRHAISVPPAEYSIIARKGAGTLDLATVRAELEKAFRQVPGIP
jgi:ribonuclease P protein component